MPVDSQVQALLDLLASSGAPDLADLDPQAARALFAAMPRLPKPPPVAQVLDLSVPGPGGDLPLRVYVPTESADPLPVVLYLHGGGWVIGSIETHDDTCRELARRAGVVVASLDYRLAPEHPWPAAVEDSFAALRWVAEHSPDWGGDPSRLAVAGDSAGGNLATITAIRARDEGGPPLRFQLLVYPVVDFVDTPSRLENAEGYFLTLRAMRWFEQHYSADPSHPWAAPLRAELAGLPPGFIMTAGYDPLRDEGEAYRTRLAAAGVEVRARRYEGLIHGFFSMFGVIEAASDALDDAAEALRTALA